MSGLFSKAELMTASFEFASRTNDPGSLHSDCSEAVRTCTVPSVLVSERFTRLVGLPKDTSPSA